MHDSPQFGPQHGAVFLSYASQDAGDARRICDALRAEGIEVWFDQSELRGGDAWDQKIRGQIRECALFVPIVSSNTQARLEGYFRVEWKLAAQRTHAMADAKPFLLPLVIDDTREGTAHTPEEFKSVQWTRLPAGVPDHVFTTRVKLLLNGSKTRTAAVAVSPVVPRPVSRHLAWAFGVVAAVALTGIASWRLWPREAKPDDASSPTSKPLPTAEERLVLQARNVLDEGDELNREDYLLADELAKRAVSQDPSNAEAWTVAAEISYRMIWYGIESSGPAVAAMRQQAERAVALAPDSFEARLVRANVRIDLDEDLDETLAELQRLAGQAPENWRVRRALGQVHRKLHEVEPAIVDMQRAFTLSGGDPTASADLCNVLLCENRYADAEKISSEGMLHKRSGRVLCMDVLLKTQWRGDVEAASAALAKWPEWLLREDRGAHLAWRTWMWAGKPDLALEAAQRAARDYLHDSYFTGPRAVLTARAHELAGHVEAAQADWREVLELTSRQLVVDLEDPSALMWKAWALERLGDHGAALAIGRMMYQRKVQERTIPFNLISIAPLWSTLGMKDAAFEELESLTKVTGRYGVARAALELDPAYAPLRGDPRFAATTQRAPAPQ
jgi:tetratricopeptide (TPR) repeat protein